MKNVLVFLKTYKIKLVFLIVVILCLLTFSIVFVFLHNYKIINTNNIQPVPTITQSALIEKTFKVLGTQPANGQTNVSAGEQAIIINVDSPIVSPSSYSLEISPPLPYYWKIMANYPTKKIAVQVFGALTTSTTYTITIKNSRKEPVYSWSFTTSNITPESSSGIAADQSNTFHQKYYPLLPYLPFTNNDFQIYYVDNLTLEVDITNSNVDMVKNEVDNWIKSHGVNPSTHKINYVNDF